MHPKTNCHVPKTIRQTGLSLPVPRYTEFLMSAPDATGDALLPEEVRTGHSEPVDRILATAYELFSHRGVRDVGINELIERSGVAKSTFYRHFPSKDALVLAFLALRDQVWTVDLIVSEARRRGTTPEGRLLAIFDVFGDWFQRDDFEACTFINVLLEMGPEHPLGVIGALTTDVDAAHRDAVGDLVAVGGVQRVGTDRARHQDHERYDQRYL